MYFEGGVTLSKSENLLLKLQLAVAAREQQIFTNASCVTLPKITGICTKFYFVGLKRW